MASPYELFGTDTKSEKDGIILDFGEFWLRIARAGGANKKFGRVLDAKMQPHRRAMQSGTLDDDLATRLLAEAYAEAVILAWGSAEHGDGTITGKDGGSLALPRENVIGLLLALPHRKSDVEGKRGWGVEE